MALLSAGVSTALFVVLPTFLWIMDEMGGDPEADAIEALRRLQTEQLGEFEFQEARKVQQELKRREEYAVPAEAAMTKASLLQSGFYDPELLGPGDPGGPGGGSLMQRVAGEVGIDPEELRARLSPRRMGNMEEMAQGAGYKPGR